MSNIFNIGFAAPWQRNNPNIWSGIPQSLMLALRTIPQIGCSKIGTDIPNFLLNYYKITSLSMHHGKPYCKFWLQPRYCKYWERNITEFISSHKNSFDAVLQIGDLAPLPMVNNYIYQDLSVDFIEDFFNTTGRKLYAYEPFSHDTIRKKNIAQKNVYKHTTGIFTMSNWLKKHMIEYSNYPENKIHAVLGGFNITPYDIPEQLKRKLKQPDEKIILFVGIDFHRKNGDTVLKAFDRLVKKGHTNIKLVIAGPTSLPRNLPISKNVIFLGRKSYSELQPYFAVADVFCMPSRFEAFGIVFAEALAAGVPCIGKNCFAQPEFITHGENGYLIDEDDPELLMQYMEESVYNDSMKRFVESKKEFYQEFYSWERVARDIVEVMKRDKQS